MSVSKRRMEAAIATLGDLTITTNSTEAIIERRGGFVAKQRVTKVDGVDYSPEGIEEVRCVMIERRNTAQDELNTGDAVVFSDVIAYLAYFADMMRMAEDLE